MWILIAKTVEKNNFLPLQNAHVILIFPCDVEFIKYFLSHFAFSLFCLVPLDLMDGTDWTNLYLNFFTLLPVIFCCHCGIFLLLWRFCNCVINWKIFNLIEFIANQVCLLTYEPRKYGSIFQWAIHVTLEITFLWDIQMSRWN